MNFYFTKLFSSSSSPPATSDQNASNVVRTSPSVCHHGSVKSLAPITNGPVEVAQDALESFMVSNETPKPSPSLVQNQNRCSSVPKHHKTSNQNNSPFYQCDNVQLNQKLIQQNDVVPSLLPSSMSPLLSHNFLSLLLLDKNGRCLYKQMGCETHQKWLATLLASDSSKCKADTDTYASLSNSSNSSCNPSKPSKLQLLMMTNGHSSSSKNSTTFSKNNQLPDLSQFYSSITEVVFGTVDLAKQKKDLNLSASKFHYLGSVSESSTQENKQQSVEVYLNSFIFEAESGKFYSWKLKMNNLLIDLQQNDHLR